MTVSRSTRYSPALLVFLLLPPLLWAGNAVVGRASVGHIGPMALSFWRWALAFIVLLPFTARAIWHAREQLLLRWRDLVAFGIVGIGAYNTLQYLALQTSPALNVTLIAAAGPITTLAIGAMFFKAGVTSRQCVGAVLSMVGVIWVIGRGNPLHVLALRLTPGDAYMLVAITAWSTYTWLLRTRRPDITVFPLLAVQIGIGALAILPFALAEAQWHPVALRLDSITVATLAYVALLPSLVAYYCWDRGVALAGATLPMYFANFTPVFTAILAIIWLGEEIALFHLIGAALIFLGIHMSNRK